MFKKWLLAVLAVISINGAAYGQGIPVMDVASIAQQVQQVVAWGQQLTQMQAQLTQAQNTFNSLNGSRGIGMLLNDASLMNALPSNWQQVYQSVQSGGYSGLTGSAKAIRDAAAVFDCSTTGTMQQLCQRDLNRNAQDQAFMQTAYQASQDRLTNIQNLMGQINNSTDPKAIADLQARMSAEQAMIQNEQTKLQLFQQLAAAQREQIMQQKYETSLKDFQSPSAARNGTLRPVQF